MTQSTKLVKLGDLPVQFSGADEALYNRHLLFDDVIAAQPDEVIPVVRLKLRIALACHPLWQEWEECQDNFQ